MNALTYYGPGDFRCETVDDPTIVDERDAIVAVELAAICGSDLHVWRGHETGLDTGTVLGHYARYRMALRTHGGSGTLTRAAMGASRWRWFRSVETWTVNPSRATDPRPPASAWRAVTAITLAKRADLVLLDASPLEDIRNIRRIAVVVANGALLDRSAHDAQLEALRARGQEE